jgi:hypothetical protein
MLSIVVLPPIHLPIKSTETPKIKESIKLRGKNIIHLNH